MAEVWEGKERRQYPRISLLGEVRGKIYTVAAAPVVNLSASGALLEVPCALNARAVYTLRLAFSPSEELELRCRVVRSYVHGFGRNERGETVIKYRAAIEFVPTAQRDEPMAILQRYITRLDAMALRTSDSEQDS